MPYVTGPIGAGGAIVDVLFGVPRTRATLLSRAGFPVPAPVHIRALLDTGASLTGVSPRVLAALDLRPFDQMEVYTPSTPPGSPHVCDRFLVSISMVAGGRACPFPDLYVMSADCWLEGEGIEALVGRDILARCNFMYFGPEGNFNLSLL